MFRAATVKGRYLKGASRTETPNNLYFLHVLPRTAHVSSKSRRRVERLRCWSGLGVRLDRGKPSDLVTHEGDSPDALWDALEARTRPRSPLWVFALDLGAALTWLNFWQALDDGRFSMGPIKSGPRELRVRGKGAWKGQACLEASPVYANVMASNGLIKFTDVLNYYPVGIDALASQAGIELTERPDDWSPPDDHLVYAAEHVAIIRTAMCQLLSEWREHDAGPWARTVAGLSLASFRRHIHRTRNTSGKQALVIARDPDSERLECEAYYGARVEPYFIGTAKGSFYKLDVSSLYPAVMASERFPTRRIGTLTAPTVGELRTQSAFRGAVAVVDIDSPDATYPVRLQGQLRFAKGTFTTTLSGAELEGALSRGHVTRCHHAILYHTARIFKQWVEYWYDVKCEASALGRAGLARRAVAKMVLNSLYGKFKQRGKRWVTLPGGPLNGERWGAWVELHEGHEALPCRAIAGVRQELREGEPPQHYFPAVAAFVTSSAREHMRKLVTVADSDNVYYIANDMLIVSEAGRQYLDKAGMIGNGKLGLLESQAVATELEICGPNYYRLGEDWTRSGGWGIAEQDEAENWSYQAREQTPSLIAKCPIGEVATDVRSLSSHGTTPTGRVLADGWVYPLTLSNVKPAEPTPKSERPRHF